MKRVLVTGGTGFVGANLARRLVADGHEVHLLVRGGHDPWRIAGIHGDVRLHVVDFRDRERLSAVVAGVRPEWVFHLAAHGAYPAQTDLDAMLDTNVMGTINLVRACLATGFEAFVNTGSSSEYGFKDHAPAETEWLDPNSDYAVSKAAATLFCRYTAVREAVTLPTLRLYSVYGPWEEPTRLMPTLVVSGLRGVLPPLVNPEVARDYVHVEDACDAYLLAATARHAERGAVYNVGTGVQTALAEVVAVARRVLGVGAEPVWGSMPARRWDTAVWVADSRRIRERLGWRPRWAFEPGFRRLVDWFRADPGLVRLYEARQRAAT
jgi:nucleoside-diphosphate-sugar epimerase